MEIVKIWNVTPQRLDTSNWDAVEVEVKRIVKGSTANAAKLRAGEHDMEM